MRYNSPFIVGNALCIFLLLEKIPVKGNRVSKLIMNVSTTTFGVYVIHEHMLVHERVLKNAFQGLAERNTLYLFLIVMFSILGIFCSGSCIEYIRKRLFKLVHVDKLIETIGSKFDKFLN